MIRPGKMMSDQGIVTRRQRSQPVSNAQEFRIGESLIPHNLPANVTQAMMDALALYQNTPYPTDKDEAWRRTSLVGLEKANYSFDYDTRLITEVPTKFLQPVIDGEQAGQLVISPGQTVENLRPEYAEAGVIFCDLFDILKRSPDKVEGKLNHLVKPQDGKFAALTAAFAVHGTFLYVPTDVKIKEPLHALFWNAGDHAAACSHHVIWVERGAEVTFVQEFASEGEDIPQFHSGTLEVFVGTGATLNFVELQSWNRSTWNIIHEKVKVEQDANLSWIFGSLGSKVTKSFSSIDLAGAGASAKVSGFYFADDSQHLDMDTEQNHLAPNTTSDLLYKGAVTGNSRSVWQGNIYVAPGANGTDGYQANKNLILSRAARADSIPGLEILADDVKCTHGATVGKIDPDQIFYLRSRGLTERDARHLIVQGFFETIMERIPFQAVSDRFRDAIVTKIDTQND